MAAPESHPADPTGHGDLFSLDKIARGELSDRAIRAMIRFGLARELKARHSGDVETEMERRMAFIEELRRSPIAVATDAANRQHYEVPTDFFRLVLGRRLKYSCCLWPEGVTDLDAAEDAMLELVCKRAGVEDGQDILDLGCGWGSLALYVAERFPRARVVGLSSSRTQREYIEAQVAARGLTNLTVATANVASWETSRRFDRILSIEMFEHMRNYEALLERVASWTKPGGWLFVHVFSHVRHGYLFEENVVASQFFAGGLMPADDTLLYFQKDMRVLEHWRVSGAHYQRTSEAWLERLDRRREEALAVFAAEQGEAEAQRRLAHWRVFFITCAESFGHAQGREWIVSHYLMERRR
ncbi:cyclopropane-fatty-acyl-phospholipid synthase family protein [Sorangium sp. So ce269]